MDLTEASVDGLRFWVRPKTWDLNIVREVIQGDCYRCKDWQPHNEATILDVGAHIGGFATWMAVRLPHCRVVAIEMDDDNFSIAQRNLDGLPNVVLHHAALGDRDGTVAREPLDAINTGNARVMWSAIDGERVSAMSVQSLFERYRHVDLLKLDCEGSEHRVLPAIKALPGGLWRVGRLCAELHAEMWSEPYDNFLTLVQESFPFVEVASTSASDLHMVYAWR